MTTEQCPFCALAAGADDDVLVLRTASVLAFPAPRQRAKNRGHILIIPAEHVTRLSDASPELLQELFGLAARIGVAMSEAFGATGSMLFQNDNTPGQVLHHVHIHVIPRREGDDFRLPDTDKDDVTHQERADQAARLARSLAVAKASLRKR